MRGRIGWVRDLQRSLNDLGGELSAVDLGRLSVGEIGCCMTVLAVRMVKSSWEAESQDCAKLDVLQRLLLNLCKLRCVDVARECKELYVAKGEGWNS